MIGGADQYVVSKLPAASWALEHKVIDSNRESARLIITQTVALLIARLASEYQLQLGFRFKKSRLKPEL